MQPLVLLLTQVEGKINYLIKAQQRILLEECLIIDRENYIFSLMKISCLSLFLGTIGQETVRIY